MYMNRGNRFAPRQPPVQVGDELDVVIEAVGTKGDGIAKKNGFVLFIPNVKEGQKVHIKVTKVLQKVGFAEVAGPAQAQDQDEQMDEQEPAESTEPMESEPSEEPMDAQEDSEDFGEEQQ